MFEHALKKGLQSSDNYFMLGLTLVQLDQGKFALPYLQRSVELNEDGWPGWGENGERIAHQESFSVAYIDYAGTEGRWLKAQVVFRGAAFSGKLYDLR